MLSLLPQIFCSILNQAFAAIQIGKQYRAVQVFAHWDLLDQLILELHVYLEILLGTNNHQCFVKQLVMALGLEEMPRYNFIDTKVAKIFDYLWSHTAQGHNKT